MREATLEPDKNLETAAISAEFLNGVSVTDGAGDWTIGNTGYSDFNDVAYSPALDRFLASGGDLPYRWSGNSFSSDARAREAIVEAMRKAGKQVFDSPKARLACDPTPGTPVVLDRTTYFEGIASNEITLRKISGPGFALNGAELAFPGGRLPRLSDSALSNHLGVCCLAFDDEGYLALTLTTAASAVSGGKISPSGAGSCDVEDFDGATDGIARAAARGMERELREELGLNSAAEIDIQVVAFRRFLDRGGKPDFIGVARVKGSFGEMISDITVDEAGFTDGIILLDARRMGNDGLGQWARRNAPRLSSSLKTAIHAYVSQADARQEAA